MLKRWLVALDQLPPMRFSDGENWNVPLKCDLVTKILTVHTCTCTLTHIPRDKTKREKERNSRVCEFVKSITQDRRG